MGVGDAGESGPLGFVLEMGRGLGKFGVGWRIEQLSEESESLTGVGCVDEEIHAQH